MAKVKSQKIPHSSRRGPVKAKHTAMSLSDMKKTIHKVPRKGGSARSR